MLRRARHRHPAVALTVVVCVLAATACSSGGGGKSHGATPSTAGANLAAECPAGAVASAPSKPVQITMWHSTTQANLQTLEKLTSQFNASQGDIHVNLVAQTSYEDTLTKYKATLAGGTRPDLVQIQDVDQQLLIDSRSVLPVDACIQAEHVSTGDFVPRVRSYYTVRGVQYSMPFATSNPVLYYNKALFRKAALDPEKPPTTLDEVRADAQKIVSAGLARYGIAIKTDPWYLEEWSAMAGALYSDHDNGRTARSTAVSFGGPAGQQVFAWLSGMARDKLGEGTPTTGFDNLLAVGNGIAAMTFDTSAALGTIFQVLASGQFKNVELGVGRLPGPVAGGPTIQSGSSLFVVRSNSPAREEAAFRFAEWLSEPAQQAVWAAGTGYVPVRTSALDQPALRDAWSRQPYLRVAYDQLTQGADTIVAEGPVIGDMEGVRTHVIDAETALFQGADPATTLAGLVRQADGVIRDYESRVSG